MCFDFDRYRAKPALRATVDDQKISQNLSLLGFGIQIGNIIIYRIRPLIARIFDFVSTWSVPLLFYWLRFCILIYTKSYFWLLNTYLVE